MSKKDSSASPKGTTVAKKASTAAGSTVWVVRHKDGRSEKVVTSRASNTTIRHGVVTYNNALKSLAKR
jgi:hypothetical protein